MIELSKEQKKILDTLFDWHKDPMQSEFITLGGYAGTGKTTLIGYLRKQLHKENKKLRVAFCSYTGKAARVLRTKLIEAKTIYPQDFCSTIHSLMYKPIEDDKMVIIGWERRDEIKFDLIIVDEASMVDKTIWDDLLDYQIPIIAVGDHGQLPPVKGKFNLMESPQLRLEEIHRQAKDNPIIKISTWARERGSIPFGEYDYAVRKIDKKDPDNRDSIESLLRAYNNETLVLCGYNFTRVKLNNYIRNAMERYEPVPKAGDRVICLRNNHMKEVYNGMIGTVRSIMEENEDWYFSEVEMDGEDDVYKGLISQKQFNNPTLLNFSKKRSTIMKGDLFDFGYALTVHKAQGSQAKRVILFEERFKQMNDDDWCRWLYTAVTRAEEELFIVA